MEPEKKSNGALVGAIIVVIILIVGGIYIWQAKVKEMKQSETTTEADSDELNALEQDLGTTDTDVGVDVNTVY